MRVATIVSTLWLASNQKNAVHWYYKVQKQAACRDPDHWLKSNETNNMMDPHNNLYQPPAEIGMSFYYTCLYLASAKYRYSDTVRGALTTVSVEIFEGVNILRMHSQHMI